MVVFGTREGYPGVSLGFGHLFLVSAYALHDTIHEPWWVPRSMKGSVEPNLGIFSFLHSCACSMTATTRRVVLHGLWWVPYEGHSAPFNSTSSNHPEIHASTWFPTQGHKNTHHKHKTCLGFATIHYFRRRKYLKFTTHQLPPFFLYNDTIVLHLRSFGILAVHKMTLRNLATPYLSHSCYSKTLLRSHLAPLLFPFSSY